MKKLSRNQMEIIGAIQFMVLVKLSNFVCLLFWIISIPYTFLLFRKSPFTLIGSIILLATIAFFNSQRPPFEGGLIRSISQRRLFVSYSFTEKVIFFFNLMFWFLTWSFLQKMWFTLVL